MVCRGTFWPIRFLELFFFFSIWHPNWWCKWTEVFNKNCKSFPWFLLFICRPWESVRPCYVSHDQWPWLCYNSTNDRWWAVKLQLCICVTVSFPAENLVQERLWTPNVSFSTLRQSQCLETRRQRPRKEKCRWGNYHLYEPQALFIFFK